MLDKILEREAAIAADAHAAREIALEYAEGVRTRLTEVGEEIKAYAVKEPARALGIALGIGVFIGWMIRRR